MSDRALFIGFGSPVRGREERAIEVFNEFVGMFGRMQSEGRIEGLDIALLDAHGGDLGGFFMVHGSEAQCAALPNDEEFRRATIDATLMGIVDRITRRLRAARRVGRTVVLRLRFGDFERATRSHTLPFATANTQAILATARALLATAMPLIERRGITLVGCSVATLEAERPRQLLLGPEESLDAAVDAIRDRYGSAAITRAVLLGRDPGFSMPLLPD